MDTVAITFFLVARFYIYKMDADCVEDKGTNYLKSRRQRWSMNSQRLEEIVAELMRPIGDLRRSFDTDLSALLEEYLTEAGLHALDADEDEDAVVDRDAGGGLHVAPNFAELALLLQQSASIYGRKVDFLYQHVLSVSEELQNSTLEITRSTEPEATAETPSRRRAAPEWGGVELSAAGAATRPAEPPRPPPTLPRAYIELEPRVMAAHDAPLLDYSGEPVGLLADFHVAWRLHEGMLVEELEGGPQSSTSLRPIPLTELQAALSAAAPPLPAPSPPPPSPPPSPPPTHASTPLPFTMAEAAAVESPMPPPVEALKRKRKREPQPEDLPVRIKLLISKEVRRELRREKEFSLPWEWVRDEVRRRSAQVLRLRRSCISPTTEFRGFEYSSCDVDGFLGWSSAEAATATREASRTAGDTAPLLADPLSDDDGFFDQSSSGDSEPSHALHNSSSESTEWWSWQAAVAARAAAQEARGGVDVRQLAQQVLTTLPPSPETVTCTQMLASAAKEPSDVSRLFLATLFLANAGNVEVIQGAPLTTDSFSLRLLSTDETLYSAAAASDAALLQPTAAGDVTVADVTAVAGGSKRRVER